VSGYAGATSHEPIRLVPASQRQLRSARRLVRRKDRESSGLFLTEGPQAIREALGLIGCVRELFVVDPARNADLVQSALAAGVDVRTLTERELAQLSDTVTPQGLVAVCVMLGATLLDVLAASPRLIVCCAQVRDPGNAGTVIRCADAFGADAVIMSDGSVDIYNPKTVRASVGSIFHLPVVSNAPLEATLGAAREAGLQIWAADGTGDLALPELGTALAAPTLWLMGNEAWGLPPEHLSLADRAVRVPIYGRAESLNLSTAAAVCLYASATAQRAGS
jgi:TrmH family RNA methyltransferase